MTEKTTLPETGFLRLPQILKLIPVGESTWWARVKAGIYPKPVKLGERTSAWRAEDIRTLIAEISTAEYMIVQIARARLTH